MNFKQLLLISIALFIYCSPQMRHKSLLKTQLFISGQEGHHTNRIPALITTNKGTILAFCEGRKRGRDDITWSLATHDSALIEPICQESLICYSWKSDTTENVLLFSNPASETKGSRLMGNRRNSERKWGSVFRYQQLANQINKII